MSRRIVVLTILLMALLGCAVPVHADRIDSLDDVATSYVEAIQSGETMCQFYTTDYDDINHMIGELFARYPMLIHYLERGESMMYPDHMEGTFYLRNTQDSLDDIWVVGSDEELLAALGMGLWEVRTDVRVVTRDDYVLTEEKIDNAIATLHYQYPVAYMGYSGRSTSWIGSESYNAKDYTITFQYHYDLNATMLQQWRGETEQAVRYLLENVVAQDMPDYQKVLLIHDWIINNTRYNTANLEEEGNHLAYGALVKGSCVCMGYAEAGLIMFQAAGLDTCYISGEATNSAGDTESHAWNAVNVDGEWYHVDMTWDDPTSADNQDILRHNYFMVTDSQLAQDHVWNRVGLPICNGKQWSGDRVLSVCAQDGGTYSMYDASRYTTLEQVRKLFAGQLTSGVEAYNALQADHDMVSNWIDDSQRDAGEDSTPQVPAALKHEKRSFPWIIVFLVLFVVIVAVCVIGTIYRATVLRRRYRRSNDPQRFKSAGYVNFD